VRFAAGPGGSHSAYPLMRVALGRWLRRAAPAQAPLETVKIKVVA